MIVGPDGFVWVKPGAKVEDGATDTGSPFLGLTSRTRKMWWARGM